MTAEASTPPVTVQVDPQNPLGESNWLFRRILMFVRSAVVIGIVAACVYAIASLGAKEPVTAIKGLVTVIQWLLVLMMIDTVLYLVAPSAEELLSSLIKLSAFIKVPGFTINQTATATAPGGAQASTTASAGQAGAAASVPAKAIEAAKAALPDWVK
jgi:hypothetical protein